MCRVGRLAHARAARRARPSLPGMPGHAKGWSLIVGPSHHPPGLGPFADPANSAISLYGRSEPISHFPIPGRSVRCSVTWPRRTPQWRGRSDQAKGDESVTRKPRPKSPTQRMREHRQRRREGAARRARCPGRTRRTGRDRDDSGVRTGRSCGRRTRCWPPSWPSWRRRTPR